MAFVSRNPANGEIVATFEDFSAAQIEDVLAASVHAFGELRSWSVADRKSAMERLATGLSDETDELARLITLEMGKPLRSAQEEIRKCVICCRYYADNAGAMLADSRIDHAPGIAYRKFLPLGPVLAVMPWNFPFWQVVRFAAPALMAGNTVLLKHAENVPQCAMAIERLVRQVGFPVGALQNLFATIDQVGAILRDERVRGATLTGSERAGSSVAAICGEQIKPSVLELGGSDAFIVMPSADLDKAVDIAVSARMQNCGQSCIAAKRFIIHADIYDAFRVRFKSAVDDLRVGDPEDPSTDVGPLVSEAARQGIHGQVENALAAGAVRVTGAYCLDGPGYYYRPGIIETAESISPACSEEIFGPVAMLFRVRSIEEAVALANDSPFGLGSAIFTASEAERDFAIEHIVAGATFVNAMTASHPALPFGGTKRSGYGRELGADGLHAFCNAKTVSIA